MTGWKERVLGRCRGGKARRERKKERKRNRESAKAISWPVGGKGKNIRMRGPTNRRHRNGGIVEISNKCKSLSRSSRCLLWSADGGATCDFGGGGGGCTTVHGHHWLRWIGYHTKSGLAPNGWSLPGSFARCAGLHRYVPWTHVVLPYLPCLR